MSLRRKSCNACFQGRRKCDLAFPTCQRCKKTRKSCQYPTEPVPVVLQHSGSTVSSANILVDSNDRAYNVGDVLPSDTTQQDPSEDSTLDSNLPNTDFGFDFNFSSPASPPIASDLLGELGDLLPLHGNIESWQWVVRQLQMCPENFAKAGENLFMHRSMYRLPSPPAIKTAFGICTASQMITPATEDIFKGSLESEVSALLNDVQVENVPETLARLQAIALYQILRLLSGDSTLQSVAEQQKNVINAWALRLLQSIHSDPLRSRTYENLVLAESIRRTVMVIYLLHAISSVFKHGVCTELPTLALLPISVDPEIWESGNVSCAFSAEGDLATMKYGEWTNMWVSFPPRRTLDAFQKMLMVACKGKAKVEELEAEMM